MSRSNKYKQITFEFLRYLLAGGFIFIIDITVLYLTKTFIFYKLGHIGILLATAVSFICVLILNYIFSFIFVFKQIDEKAQRNKVRSIAIFIVIGITGLLLTEICMHIGIIVFGEEWYLAVKAVTSWVVFIWNYIGRKVFIFRGAGFLDK